MTRTKGNQVHTDLYLPPATFEQLKQLSKQTRISVAAYLREAVDDLLEKHAVPPKPRGKSR